MRQINQAGLDLIRQFDPSASGLHLYEQAIEGLVQVPLNDNQFSALVSLLCDVQLGGFIRSNLLKLLNQGEYTEAADRLLAWTRFGNEERRKAERDLFLALDTLDKTA